MEWRDYVPGGHRSIVRALKDMPNGERVMAASYRQMQRELVRLVIQADTPDRNERRRKLKAALDLAQFLRDLEEEWNDELRTWR